MSEVIIFGGTTEGRLLAEFCHKNRIKAIVSVASGYGKQVLPVSPYLDIRSAPIDEFGMEELFNQETIRLVIDATHPYAVKVTQNLQHICRMTHTSYVRVLRSDIHNRESGAYGGFSDRVIWVDTIREAVEHLKKTDGNIFVTTGSKELMAFTQLDSFLSRVYARVLPSKAVVDACEQMGIRGKHLIGMQGPFSKELNVAMLKQTKASYLVTKEAGFAGGFIEKLNAAEECGVTAVVIGRPTAESGVSLETAKSMLKQYREDRKRTITLIGIGMGGSGQLTLAAVKSLRSCDAVLGAKRMLQSVSEFTRLAHQEPCYLSGDVQAFIEGHSQYQEICVVYSGDTGFYSGARQLLQCLKDSSDTRDCEIVVIPGISSVSYLCARLETTWEDAGLISMHGRSCDFMEELKGRKKLFILLDGTNTVSSLCKTLLEHDMDHVRVSVGERLSYPEERIVSGPPSKLSGMIFDPLSAVLLELE